MPFVIVPWGRSSALQLVTLLGPLEFQPGDAKLPTSYMVGEGPFDLEAGQWTDDTSIALCLAASLIA